MPVVDALDSGQITREEFIEDGPILQLARSLSLKESEHMHHVLALLSQGSSLNEVLHDSKISPHIERARHERINH